MAASASEMVTDRQPNDFLRPLKLLLDTRAINLLLNILSKMIQDPNDKRYQDLNYETIHKKIGDCKAAFDVLYAIGFKKYTSSDDKQEQRMKIEINENNLSYIKYVYAEIEYKYSDRSRVHRQEFDCRELMAKYPPKFKDGAKQLIFKSVCPNLSNDCMGTMVYGRHKLIQLPSTIPDPTDFIKNKLKIKSNIFEYISNNADASKLHFYVNFADNNLFGYYRGSLFAQDEIMTTEHPILGSLREKLVQSYHACKDNTKLVPKCDGAVVILNAIKHGHFNQESLAKIYGNRFRITSNEMILQCLEICKPPIIDNIICIVSLMGSNNKYREQQIRKLLQTAYCGFNGAKCEAMYQSLKRLRNPNAACLIEECNHNQLLWVLSNDTLKEGKLLENRDLFLRYFKEKKIDGKMMQEMSRKAFGAAIVEYGEGRKSLNGPAMKLYRTLRNYGDLIEDGIFDGYMISDDDDDDDDEKKVDVEYDPNMMKKIVVHTGNWGCGAFGGNIELHFILQLIAGIAAGIDEMYYHSVDDKSMIQVVTGCHVLLNQIYPNCKDKKGKIKRDLFIAELFKRGYMWGTPNGT